MRRGNKQGDAGAGGTGQRPHLHTFCHENQVFMYWKEPRRQGFSEAPAVSAESQNVPRPFPLGVSLCFCRSPIPVTHGNPPFHNLHKHNPHPGLFVILKTHPSVILLVT